MDGYYFGKEAPQDGVGYGYKEPDYSSPLYTLSLLKQQVTYLNNLIKTLESQIKGGE